MASSISDRPAIQEPCDVIVLGAGAAGMMAAAVIGERAGSGRRVVIVEKNARPGIKVLVCGGGRCNFTNAGTLEFLIEQFGRNGRFLTPALEALDNEGLRELLRAHGVPSHVEHDGKVYPDSNQAKSVVDALARWMAAGGVMALAGAEYAATAVERDAVSGSFLVRLAGGRVFSAAYVVLALGGMSYQRMGTVGDGYRIAQSLGHAIITPRPAIVGLLAAEAGGWTKPLQGLAVRDVEVTIEAAGKTSKGGRHEGRKSRGDMLITHFGLSGPAVLNPSEIVAELLEKQPIVALRIDFIPEVTHEQAHETLRAWKHQYGKKRIRTMLSQNVPEVVIQSTSPDQTAMGDERQNPRAASVCVPARLGEAICHLEQVSPEQICAELTSAQMHRLVERLKRCAFTVTGTRGFKEAMVTAGGVKLSEVDPRTMESKIVPRLYLTGEVMDLTGPSGGYNLQLAFSTGYLAGMGIAKRLRG